MEIGPSTHGDALQATQHALAQLSNYRALMFVSANAVRHFFAHSAWQAHPAMALHQLPRCWSPGPGTSHALRQIGIPLERIDAPAADAAQFDSESLWAQVQHQPQPGECILIVRGDAGEQAPSAQGRGRAWLTEQLQARGVQVDFAPVYTRHPPAATPVLLSRITALHAQHSMWLFSSSDCIHHLQALAPSLDWAQHTAIATHPRIAQQAQRAGFGCILHSHPTLSAIIASIKSLA